MTDVIFENGSKKEVEFKCLNQWGGAGEGGGNKSETTVQHERKTVNHEKSKYNVSFFHYFVQLPSKLVSKKNICGFTFLF